MINEPSALKDLPPSHLAKLQTASFWLSLLLGGGWILAMGINHSFPNVLFAGVQGVLLWVLTAAVIQYLFFRFEAGDRADEDGRSREEHRGSLGEAVILSAPLGPAFARRWQWLVVLGAALLIGGQFLWEPAWQPLTGEGLAVFRWATAAYLAVGCLLYFFINFAAAVQKRLESVVLDSVLILSRLAFWLCVAAAGLAFLFLATGLELSAWLGWPALILATLLALEPLVRFGLRFYQPKEARQSPPPAGNSLVLDALWGRGHDLGTALRYFESLAGTNLSDVWIFKFLRQTGLLIVSAVILFGWLSTCFTAVPVGSRGVRMTFGRVDPVPLPPGLHLNLLWPLGRIDIVQTELIHTVSLGFDRDLNGPVLWSEKHVEGEKNLLIGDGEALLTINIPILYRISDPVAYLKTVADPEQALSDLAERKLLHVMGSRESFDVMIKDRALISQTLRTDLQGELDRLHLGIELVFVGLQDVHPPVDVAPAYQEVISAQEEEQTLVDRALAARARSLPAAQAEATKLSLQADAAATEKVAKAQGSVARFVHLAAVDRTSSDLFRMQIRLAAIEASLGPPIKVILGIPTDRAEELYLDLRDTNELPPP